MVTPDELTSAWERVRDNNGCAGADGVTISSYSNNTPKRLERLLESILTNRYRPVPLLAILIAKAPGKTRRLLVPSVGDRILQTAVARQLSRSFEDEFLDVSFAYRPGRGVDRAVARVLQLRDRGYQFVVDADVTAFFDSVPHSQLRELLGMESIAAATLGLIHQWLAMPVWDGTRVKPLHKGIPQGSPISPVLANFFLHDLDVQISKSDFHIVRYADDFLILCDSPAGAERAKEMAAGWLQARQLEFHPEKTRVASFEEGFRFLGVQFEGQEAMVPWKAKRTEGGVVSMARPMPVGLLKTYLRPVARTAMADGLSKAMQESGLVLPRKQGGKAVSFLYLTEQGSVLRKSGDRLLVEFDSRVLLDLPYHKLEAVLVFGNVQVTTQALGELMDKGIRVSFLTRQGRFRGSVRAPQGLDVRVRMGQLLGCDGGRALPGARAVLRAKVLNGLEVLRLYGRGTEPAEAEELGRLVAGMGEAESLAELMGLEGSAAKVYFEAVMRFNVSAFPWKGRERRPPKDPVNALLSLSYMLLITEFTGLLEAHGLDAYLGFLHQPDHGRPSLALDLVEPFRHPVADRFVLTALNKRVFQADDFLTQEGTGATQLLPEAFKRFVRHWEEWMTAAPEGREGKPAARNFRREMARQVEMLVGHWREGASWEPWLWDHYLSAEEERCDSSSAMT